MPWLPRTTGMPLWFEVRTPDGRMIRHRAASLDAMQGALLKGCRALPKRSRTITSPCRILGGGFSRNLKEQRWKFQHGNP